MKYNQVSKITGLNEFKIVLGILYIELNNNSIINGITISTIIGGVFKRENIQGNQLQINIPKETIQISISYMNINTIIEIDGKLNWIEPEFNINRDITIYLNSYPRGAKKNDIIINNNTSSLWNYKFKDFSFYKSIHQKFNQVQSRTASIESISDSFTFKVLDSSQTSLLKYLASLDLIQDINTKEEQDKKTILFWIKDKDKDKYKNIPQNLTLVRIVYRLETDLLLLK